MSDLPRRGEPVPSLEQAQLTSPADVIQEMIAGAWRLEALRAFVAYDCAQLLRAHGALTVRELAEHANAHPAGLEPVLMALEPFGYVRYQSREEEAGLYRLGPVGEYLLPDHPTTMLPAVEWNAYPLVARAMDDLVHTVHEGRPAVVDAAGGMYGYLQRHPRARELFDQVMAVRTARIAPIVAGREFGDEIVDLGGGIGVLLAHTLRAHPQARGYLIEREEVAKRAQEHLAGEQGIEGRWEVRAGDIFNPVHIPEGVGDYVAASIVHNLPEQQARELLTTIRGRMAPGSRLWLVDMVVPPTPEPHPSRDLGLRMLSLFGAGERRLEAHVSLLESAGLRIAERIFPLPGGLSLIICAPDGSEEPR
ncbi:hypothetical protein Sme01_62600 [Sphaerisporangium melleum]|uniref:O-methyltransferase n=1 Tax=Sphaerisporangium melleum TaxID=321316 RepID=A0A917R1K3_9ACTN|nr:methyltransferase [Sphaerisporangium melleum]GGK81928.1 hypothetical protein GCM10007964_25740 [Sphaerisporangium melleum]GII73784.1 hypothetical protein Sme01_62600 [Sphaerisporangium melleum]